MSEKNFGVTNYSKKQENAYSHLKLGMDTLNLNKNVLLVADSKVAVNYCSNADSKTPVTYRSGAE